MSNDGEIFNAVHEDNEQLDGQLGRFEIVPEVYDENELQYYKYFTENELLNMLQEAHFNDLRIGRLQTNRSIEINNNKIILIGKKQ